MNTTVAWFYFGGSKQFILDDAIARGADAIEVDPEEKTIQLHLVGNAAAIALPIYKRIDFDLRQGHYRTLRYRVPGTKGRIPDFDKPANLLFSIFDPRAIKMIESDKRRFLQEIEVDKEKLAGKREARNRLPAGVDPRGIDKEIDEFATNLNNRIKDGMTLPAAYLESGEPLKVVEKLTGGDREVVIKTGGEVEISADCSESKICLIQWPIGAEDKAMYAKLGSACPDPLHIQVLHRFQDGRYRIEEYRNCLLKGEYPDNQPEYRLLFYWQSHEVVREGVSGGI